MTPDEAYRALAVANSNAPLLPEHTGYIELVASPDPRVAPMVFALEHTKVRVGRFSPAGTYATTSDLLVAVVGDAISPMNTMFEHLDGAFHAFDTRSVNGTFVNGEQIKKRRRLAPGDTVDIGGAPEDGGARVVFLGTEPPAGRAVVRAPGQTRHHWQSPRNKLAIDVDSAAGTARATSQLGESDWRAELLEIARAVARLTSPHLPVSTLGETAPDLVDYQVGEPLTELPANWLVEPRRASAIVADLCDAAATCHRATPKPVIVGPFEHGLVWLRPKGRAVLFGAGLARLVHRYDAATRGKMLTMRHFQSSPEEMTGTAPVAPATDAFFAALFWVELVMGREPYPPPLSNEYFAAVSQGNVALPPGTPPVIARAFAPDPARRPALAAFASALRG